MSTLCKGLILNIALIMLQGCSINNASKTDVSSSDQEIKQSAPVKLKNMTSQDKVDVDKDRSLNQQPFRVLSKPLEVNKTMTDVYLLKLKAIELLIENLDKANSYQSSNK